MIKLYFIPNYGNEEEIRKVLKQNKIDVIGKSYTSEYLGCDSPFIINVDCSVNTIKDIIKNNSFPDSVWIES